MIRKLCACISRKSMKQNRTQMWFLCTLLVFCRALMILHHFWIIIVFSLSRIVAINSVVRVIIRNKSFQRPCVALSTFLPSVADNNKIAKRVVMYHERPIKTHRPSKKLKTFTHFCSIMATFDKAYPKTIPNQYLHFEEKLINQNCSLKTLTNHKNSNLIAILNCVQKNVSKLETLHLSILLFKKAINIDDPQPQKNNLWLQNNLILTNCSSIKSWEKVFFKMLQNITLWLVVLLLTLKTWKRN